MKPAPGFGLPPGVVALDFRPFIAATRRQAEALAAARRDKRGISTGYAPTGLGPAVDV